MSESEGVTTSAGWKAAIAAHPIIAGVFISLISIGAVLGVLLLADDWSLARRIAAGAVAGAGVSLLVTAPRIIG